ncbi:hypothetical protein CAEBREN_20583 [Caenorhabditis brenneri]|uniref:7TM GPCR serpentine receptor class x (Srx) domain-containing protein n=1 Tax=Caenorhabditis brenneri TaxID=135651 RepID=G0MTZ4_CAEBE|nr:hypothetical protein CAEBREN_20583 [Caenorhabditis brenneri]
MELTLNSQLQKIANLLFDVAGFLDLFTNYLVVYLVIWKSKNMKTFRYYLLYFQLTTAIMDVYLAFLMKPIPIFPVIGGYTTGILYSCFEVNSHIQMTIQILFMGVQEVAIFCAFFKKHQSIVTINRKLEMKKRNYWSVIGVLHFDISAIVVLFYFGRVSKEQQLEYIRRVFLEKETTKSFHN